MYEYLGDQALHTKALVVGDDLTIAGSCNFDMRSVYLDTELMLAIRSPQPNRPDPRTDPGASGA